MSTVRPGDAFDDGMDGDEAFGDLSAEAGDEPERAIAECASCPLALMRGFSRDVQPEVTLHLLAAAREMLLAMETVVRAAEHTVQRNAARSPAAERAATAERAAPKRVRHIDIA